ncbi:MAG: hypothetical protein J5858_00590, partial [Lentisphaeria bacterium]|nr:hypothetical protein [Lentisphaeria bacterium]
GTPAASLPGRVSVDKIMTRLERAKAIKDQAIMNFARGLIGQQETILVERRCSEEVYEGLSSNFARIHFRSKENVCGKFCKVQVVSVSDEKIIGAKPV